MRTPWPSRSAPHHAIASQIDGSPNAARVDGDVRVLLADVLERVEAPRRREALLGAGDVEPDHAHVAVADGQLGDLATAPRGASRSGGKPMADAAAGCAAGHLAETLGEYRLDHRIQPQPALDVQLWCEADLGATTPSAARSSAHSTRDERVPGLHHSDGVAERLQVALQGARVRGAEEPGGDSSAGLVGRQGRVADGVRQLHDRRRAQPPCR